MTPETFPYLVYDIVMSSSTVVMSSSSPPSASRMEDLLKFDSTKLGVKGLVDSGITKLPPIFRHPNLNLKSSSSSLSIPVIDISLPRSEVVEQVSSACRTWGFFQIINHDIPVPTALSTLDAVRSFNEDIPQSTRSEFYSRDSIRKFGFSFSSNVDLYTSSAAGWRDTMQIRTSPVPPVAEKIPEVCRNEVLAWDEKIMVLGGSVLGYLAQGLGLESGRLEELSLKDGRLMVCHYYPKCPEPELALGLSGHSDPGAITLLLQDHIGGLQIRKEGEGEQEVWIDVKPIPGAIIVNIGDLMQIMSNDVYKSMVHRVVANTNEDARISIAVFFSPGKKSDSDLYGPLPELVSEATPAQFKNFTVQEFMTAYFSKQLDSRVCVDHFRI